MNGVTGRMGTNQHLVRSIVAIRKEGGLKINDALTVMPEPILVGRNEVKLKALAEKYAIENWSTDLEACLNSPEYEIYFDAQITDLRPEALVKAARAGKAIYCEKPIAGSLELSIQVCRDIAEYGVKNGVVQDKLWLPGLIKLKKKLDEGYFGSLLAIRGEFGYWVFDGSTGNLQRPSWNYRKEDGGGMVVDMFSHWQYVLQNLFGNIKSVSCITTTHLTKRWNEENKPYKCTADDAAYATFELETGVIAQFNSSWNTRVRRDDLFTLQVDGVNGSAVAGLTKCWLQSDKDTPRYVWNPDEDDGTIYNSGWVETGAGEVHDNAFKIQWEKFLRYVVNDEPFPWTLVEGARGLQLTECALESHEKKAWVQIDNLKMSQLTKPILQNQ